MKRLLPLALGLLACTLARAEDVRLTSGKVLRNVVILGADPDKIVLKENKVGASGVGYPWSMINPEDAKVLYTQMLEKRKADDLSKRMEEGAQVLQIKVMQVMSDGILARAFTVVEYGYNGIQITPTEVEKDKTYYIKDEIEQPIFIYVKDTSNIVDGEKAVVKLYPAGIYRYNSTLGANKTVRAWCANLKVAVEMGEKL